VVSIFREAEALVAPQATQSYSDNPEALTLSIELAGQVSSMCAIALRKFGLEEAAAAAMGIPP